MAVACTIVALLNRSKTPRQRPVRPPRVFLSREENKSINALRPLERVACYALAAYVAVCVLLIQNHVNGFATSQLWKLIVSLLLAVLLAVAGRFGNRLFAGIAGVVCVYGPAWNKYVIAATPLFGLMLFFTFRISNQRRRLTEERLARGDLGVDPRTAARQTRNSKGKETATADASGRALASASKRYTPPKAKRK